MLKKILLIDNFDSFTFNLVDYFKRYKCKVEIYRNNIPVKKVAEINPDLIVMSPGPGNPEQAGNLLSIVKRYYTKYPMFGVCLGHQAIVQALGGTLRVLGEPYHGKQSLVTHDEKNIYKNLPNPIEVGRYHSLVGYDIPDCLEVTATVGRVVMGVRHKKYPVEGVQFHPESILSYKDNIGLRIIKNVITQ